MPFSGFEVRVKRLSNSAPPAEIVQMRPVNDGVQQPFQHGDALFQRERFGFFHEGSPVKWMTVQFASLRGHCNGGILAPCGVRA